MKLTDEKIKQVLISVDPETKRLPPGMKAFAHAIENEIGFDRAELWLKRINDAVLAEREACALLCINIANKPSNVILGVAINCATAIRARGQA